MKINNAWAYFMFIFSVLESNGFDAFPLLNSFNNDRVAVLQKNIDSEFKKNKYIRLGCVSTIGAGVVLASGLIIKHAMMMSALEKSRVLLESENIFTKRFYGSYVSTNDISKAVLDTNKKTNDIKNQLESIDPAHLKKQKQEAHRLYLKNQELEKKLAARWNWMPGFSSIVTGYVGMLVNSAIVGFLSSQMIGSTHFLLKPVFKGWSNVFHDGNITWYVMNKTRIKKIYTELEALSEELSAIEDQEELSEKKQEKEQIIISIVHAINCLTADIEKLVAFMLYKHEIHKKDYAFAAHGMRIMAHNVIDESTIFVKAAQNILQNENQHKDLVKVAKKFYKKLNAHKRGFMMYEDYPEESFV